MKVRDIMRRGALTIDAGAEIQQAAETMVWGDLRHLPVVHDGRLAGMLTETHIAMFRTASGDPSWWHAPVSAAMNPTPQWCGPDDSLTEVESRMASAKLDAFPVLDHGAIVGIVTVTDVLNAHVRQALTRPQVSRALVADAMTADPMVTRPDAPLLEAAARMRDRRVRHIPVVDTDGTLLGMLSDLDLRTTIGDPLSALDPTQGARAGQLRVADALGRAPAWTTPDQRCTDAARELAASRTEAIAVVDDARRVVGVLSYVDLLRALSS
jgi:CBS domain-containing protein